MSETPPATPLAREISAKFDRLMRQGGRIDQILAGRSVEKPPRLSEAETERVLANLEIQIVEYRDAMRAALHWHAAWKRTRMPKGFKIKRN